MAQAIREQITGTTPQDIRKINDNMEELWYKVHGDLNFEDNDKDVQNKLLTQFIQVQQEGNLDLTYPMYIRFYIPPNVKKVKSTSFNINVENYRMDSDIAMAQGQSLPIDVSCGCSSSSITASVSTCAMTSGVKRWNFDNNNYNDGTEPPSKHLNDIPHGTEFNYKTISGTYEYDGAKGFGNTPITFAGESVIAMDLMKLNHCHDISHSHEFVQSPHTHTITASVVIPPHTHNLREGIKVSTIPPENVLFSLNGVSFTTLSYGNPSVCNIDVKDYVKIGEWNKIMVTSQTVARVVFYGIIEVVMKQSY